MAPPIGTRSAGVLWLYHPAGVWVTPPISYSALAPPTRTRTAGVPWLHQPARVLWLHQSGTSSAGVLLCVAMALPVWWISLFSGHFLYIYNCKVFLWMFLTSFQKYTYSDMSTSQSAEVYFFGSLIQKSIYYHDKNKTANIVSVNMVSESGDMYSMFHLASC